MEVGLFCLAVLGVGATGLLKWPSRSYAAIMSLNPT